MNAFTHNLPAEITNQVAMLATLPLRELRALWLQYFGQPASTQNRTYLERHLGYRIQEVHFARFNPELIQSNKARIESLMHMAQAAAKPVHDDRIKMVPGTTLTRDYMGKTHTVIAHPDGTYNYKEKPYRSLTAIAQDITGMKWSGPDFFGLRPKRVRSRSKS